MLEFRRVRVSAVLGGFAAIALCQSVGVAQQSLSYEREQALRPKDGFKECAVCPEMVVVPAGSFTMGSPASERGRDTEILRGRDTEILRGRDTEYPQHQVTFLRQFTVGKFALTFDEWDACVADGGCKGYSPKDEGWGRGKRPVINVSWNDAQTYVAWLSRKTGKIYRLLSESEREYVTRAGTTTPFWWGSSISPQQANYNGEFAYDNGKFAYDDGTKGEYQQKTMPVDSFLPNPWGLYQVHGNVLEWVEDCWNDSYSGAPTDGSVWTSGSHNKRVVRGGSWNLNPGNLRSANRGWLSSADRINFTGFRVARTLR